MDWTKVLDKSKVCIQQVKNPIIRSKLPSGGCSVNPYIGCPHACMYCYVPYMKHGPCTEQHRPWGTGLTVKQWSPIPNAVARGYALEHITIGSSTDPYLPVEPHFRRTRAILEELIDSGATVSIITKSNLVLNDLDLLTRYTNAHVCVSINTLDEKFKDDMDAAPSIAERIKTLQCCKDVGIVTSCFISPIFPGVTDVFEIIETVRNHCDSIWLDSLNLQQGNFGKITGYISSEYSHLFLLYKEIYQRGDTSYWIKLSEEVKEFARKQGMEYVTGKLKVGTSPIGRPAIIDYLPRRVNKVK